MTRGYGRLLCFVRSLCGSFRLARQRNLALLVLGISRVRDGHITAFEIARSAPTRADHIHNLMHRFVASDKWAPQNSSLGCFATS